jgi:hypothetical protein
MNRTIFSFLFASVVPFVAACGSLAESPEEPTTLATMNGTLTVASGAAAPGTVRVALVWRQEGRDRFNVAEDLPVTPEFPSRFRLTVRQPPPAAALMRPERDFDMDIAIGSVIAYEDKNRNAKLDLVPAKATSFVDAIVGANDGLLVVWLPSSPTPALARELRDSQGAVPRAGYNLFVRKTPSCTVAGGTAPGAGGAEPAPGAPSAPCAGTVESRWLPIDAPFDLPIVTDPRFDKLMCESEDPGPAPDGPPQAPSQGGTAPIPPGPSGDGGVPVPEGPFPPAGAKGLVCSPNGRSFTYADCREPSLCEAESSCGARVETLPEGAAPPAGWPCTVR